MDVYDYLVSNNLIRREKIINEKKKKKMIQNKIYKYKVIKLDQDNENDDITITTGFDNYTDKKNKKILKYTDTRDEEDYINIIFQKFSNLLVDYTYISEDYDNLKLGGYVRYINLNEELRFGGILIAKENEEDIFNTRLVLKNTTNNIWKISLLHNYIFYKSHKTKNDKFKNLFLKVAMLD